LQCDRLMLRAGRATIPRKVRRTVHPATTWGKHMSTLSKRVVGLLLMPALFGLTLLTSGCNTVKGMGEDVSAAGQGVSTASQKTEDKIKEESQ
jgi:entericidin B